MNDDPKKDKEAIMRSNEALPPPRATDDIGGESGHAAECSERVSTRNATTKDAFDSSTQQTSPQIIEATRSLTTMGTWERGLESCNRNINGGEQNFGSLSKHSKGDGASEKRGLKRGLGKAAGSLGGANSISTSSHHSRTMSKRGLDKSNRSINCRDDIEAASSHHSTSTMKRGLGRSAKDIQAKQEAISGNSNSHRSSCNQSSLRSIFATRAQNMRGLGKNRSPSYFPPVPGAQKVGGDGTTCFVSAEQTGSSLCHLEQESMLPLDASVVLSNALILSDDTSVEDVEKPCFPGSSREQELAQTACQQTASPANEDIEVIEGTPLSMPSNGKHSRRKTMSNCSFFVFILPVVGAVMTLVVLLILRANVGDDVGVEFSPTANFSHCKPDGESPFSKDVPVSIMMEIEKRDSPESQANKWMCNDPHLEEYPIERQMQRFAMVSFFYATNGLNWYRNDHWLDYGVSECEWYSAYDEGDDSICDGDSTLLIFDFHSNNLHGSVPGLTHFYPKVRHFNVANNYLGGPPPPLASKITDLEVFVLSNNQLEGPLIADAGFASFSVRVVKLDGNAFSGNVNPIFGFLPKLEVLNLTSNAFANEVPFQLRFAQNLKYLGMGYNQWYGTLPSVLGALSNLQEMSWRGNADIVGTIPSQYGMLTRLEYLDVLGTQLAGSIPKSLCGGLGNEGRSNRIEVSANCSQVVCCI